MLLGMQQSDIIKRLERDKDYYGEFGSQFLSNSDISALLNDPVNFKKRDPNEPKHFKIGRLLHIMICEPEKIDTFYIVDAETRASKKFKDAQAANTDRSVLLSKEMSEVSSYARALKSNLYFYSEMHDPGNHFEIPGITEIGGLIWKGKADIKNETNKKIIDIKTTGDIEKFRFNAKKYNYDSAAYIYEQIFGYRMEFFVICKKTLKLGRFYCSDHFIESGERKVFKAIKQYEKYFSKGSVEDPEEFFINEQLF
jgi:hypothetical protein